MLYGVSNYVLNFHLAIITLLVITLITIWYILKSGGEGALIFAFIGGPFIYFSVIIALGLFVVTTGISALTASPCEAQPKAF